MLLKAFDLMSITRFARTAVALAGLLFGAASSQAFAIIRPGFTSSEGLLTITAISPAPEIAVPPQSTGAAAGAQAAFSVEAVGYELTYQWFFNDVAIPDAQNAIYAFKASAAREGTYRVVVSSGMRSVSSDPVTFTLYTRPKATLLPRGQTLEAGEPLTLTATATGTPAPSFQWYLDGEVIPGATSATFQIDAVDVFDTGAYKVQVTNDAGSAFSAPASVVVRSAPGIAASPDDIETQAGKTVRLHVNAMGFPKLSYQWRFNGQPIPGKAAHAATYAFKATLARAGIYDVVVTNALGEATSEVAEVVVSDIPRVVTRPRGGKFRTGQAYQLLAGVTGFPAPTYQWLKNGEEIEGQTGATLDFAGLTLADAGSYSVRVSNVYGTITTSPVEVLVSVAPFSVGTASVFRLNGMIYAVTGDSEVVNEQHTFSSGKIRIYSFDDGDVDRFAYSYTRLNATQARIRITTKMDGTNVSVTYVFTFATNTVGTFTASAYAKGYGTFASGGGSFTYTGPGL